jgi:elongation factor G
VTFVNKMDKISACIDRASLDLTRKLGVPTLVAHLPLFRDGPGYHTGECSEAGSFCGVVDLLSGRALVWEDGGNGETARAIEMPEGIGRVAAGRRAALVEALVDMDDRVGELVLGGDGAGLSLDLPEHEVRAALRRVTIARKATVVLCGSALKNTAVQPLLDAIVDYLPSPSEVPRPRLASGATLPPLPASAEDALREAPLIALAFKVQNRAQVGPLVFMRIYQGVLSRRDTLWNASRGERERMTRLVMMRANTMEDVEELGPGSIGAAAGLRLARTGDTLLAAAQGGKGPAGLARGAPVPVLEGVAAPESVFVCAVECESSKDEERLAEVLALIEREDPSVRVSRDAETGQTLVAGMGELHLEVVQHRITTEYNLPNVTFGAVRIAYRETAGASFALPTPRVFDQQIGARRHMAGASAEVSPLEPGGASTTNTVTIEGEDGLGAFLPWVRNGVQSALGRGPLLGFPVVGTAVRVSALHLPSDTATENAVTGVVRDAVAEALRGASARLLEPVMRATFSTPEPHVGTIISDLTSRRRAHVHAVSGSGRTCEVIADVPLAEIVGYSSTLRSLTSGEVNFEMQFQSYEPLSHIAQQNLLKASRGF